jgi:hypothetical protein
MTHTLPSSFDALPDDADVWMYAADRPLDAEDQRLLTIALDDLLETWSSHGRKVSGAYAVLSDRLLVISAHVANGSISGCGIDKSLHVLDPLARERGFEWVDGLSVVYRSGTGEFETCTRSEFRTLASGGDVNADTPVVDLSVGTLEALRAGGVERPAGTSWHGRAFDLRPAGRNHPVDARASV